MVTRIPNRMRDLKIVQDLIKLYEDERYNLQRQKHKALDNASLLRDALDERFKLSERLYKKKINLWVTIKGIEPVPPNKFDDKPKEPSEMNSWSGLISDAEFFHYLLSISLYYDTVEISFKPGDSFHGERFWKSFKIQKPTKEDLGAII